MSKGSTWKETILGTLIDIFDHVRVPLNSRQRAERKGQYPYYGASGIIDSIDGYLFDGSYLLVAEDGENLNSRKLPVAFMATGKFWVNNHAHIIKGKAGIADDYFLLAWFAGANIGGYITGAAQPKLSQANLKNIRLLVPPYPIQRRISAVLSAYDDLIENNTRRIAILESMAQALYQEWFVRFRFPGHENVPLVPSALGDIPQGWEVKPFGDVAINFDRMRKPLSSIQRASKKGSYPYYGAAKVFDYIDDYIFDGKYLLVAEDGSVITPDRKPVLQLAYGKFWANNHTHILQGRGPFSTEFLYLALSDCDVAGYVTGAAQPKITQANMNRIPVVVAVDGVQNEFSAAVLPLFDQRQVLLRKNEVLRKTRDLLLPRLISGQIDVEHLDIDVGADLVGATP